MEKYPQSFDVCVVCALPEEARAFLTVVRPHSQNGLEEYISPRYGYSYRSGALKNNKGELLILHISWLPRYGPQEMTLHLSHVLEECQPRIAIMTGICAGDARQVQLGDLIIAECTFTYDNGKFVSDEQGRKVHMHDTRTYQLDANILQFLGLFDDWMPLVAGLETPSSVLDQRKAACHIKAMASGSAVRADNPFQDVQAPVRGTVAIDMEGAAFGLVMSRHPLTRWLIVKGVCDYADKNKNDAYHDYAARASASYALRFIQAYVTNERLPRPNEPSSSSRAGPPPVWNVPHERNPYFTGRDELLKLVEQSLSPAPEDSRTTRRAALTQTQAIQGLGGIGKTQVAVEYAYRSRDLGRYDHVLWINAANEEVLFAGFAALVELLPAFPATKEMDRLMLAKAVKSWLEQCEQRWLLIFDNADDISLVHDFLPRQGKGSVLLTTRAHAVGSLGASAIEVESMGLIESAEFLLYRAQRQHVSEEEREEAINLAIALDCFPLALDQAGAYIEETASSFVEYLEIYQNHRKELLARRGGQTTRYPDSVATTWSLSFEKVEQANAAAADLLRLCAFLAPDSIPEELIMNSADQWSPLLQQAAADLFTFNSMMEELLKYSLVNRLSRNKTFSIHRLVQAVQMDKIKQEVQRQWAERVVRAVNRMFPGNPLNSAIWPQCRRYLGQVQECNELIKRYAFSFIEVADLLSRTGIYLEKYAFDTIVESLYLRALEIREQHLGADHYDTINSLNHLANLYLDQARYAEAEKLYKKVIAICEEESGPELAIALNGLALLHFRQGKFVLAEKWCKQALAIYESASEPESRSLLHTLAQIYQEQGNGAEAEKLYLRVLKIDEQELEDGES
ncbi:MAG TPA: tetratricopeptide repeat protein [Ktedonobacteraceae bacterium]|nr:tetratricopeptide repeat protein [Ktedonobacteraceae bacterium]